MKTLKQFRSDLQVKVSFRSWKGRTPCGKFWYQILLTTTGLLVLAVLGMGQTAWAQRVAPVKKQVEALEETYQSCPKGFYRGFRLGRERYEKDDFLWVVTPKFAKDYCMPEEFVDAELEGADAVAYRAIEAGETGCTRKSGEERCSRALDMQFVVYVRSKLLPRVNPNVRIYNRFPFTTYNIVQSKTDPDRYAEHLKKIPGGFQPYPFLIDLPVMISFFSPTSGQHIASHKRLSVKNITPSTLDEEQDILEMTASGGAPGDYRDHYRSSDEARIVFHKPTDPVGPLEQHVRGYGHTIKLPRKFFTRVMAHDYQYDQLPFSTKPSRPALPPQSIILK